MKREETIAIALEHGFMLSTAYGQDSKKLMPVSDTSTILAFAAAIRAATKEEDAKICDQFANVDAQYCADAIRASK